MSIEAIQRELDKARNRIRELEEETRELLSARKRAEAAEEQADYFKKELADLHAQKKIEATKKAKEHIDSLKEESDALKTELERVESKIGELTDELKLAKQRAKQAEANVTLLSAQLEQAAAAPPPSPGKRIRKSQRR